MTEEYQHHVFEDMLYSSIKGDDEIWFVRLKYESLLEVYHSYLPEPFNQKLP